MLQSAVEKRERRRGGEVRDDERRLQ